MNNYLDKDVKEKIIKLILKYRPIWTEYPHDVGYHKYVKHRIILTDKLPPSQKQRFWPTHKQEEAEKLINALEKEGIISNWVGNWETNVVLVSKKADPANKAIKQPLLDQILDTTTLPGPLKAKFRLCIDLRPTNSVTEADVAMLGNMESMFRQLAGKNVMSSFDFMDGFFQIGLTEDSKGTTFFVSRKSGSCIMKFNRSIQGSKYASAVFTRAMQVTFSHLQDIVNFWVDNLIAHSKTVEEHLEHLDTIFARTLDSSLKMSPEKCKFLAGEIKYDCER